jgi:hypothetical protein
VRLTVTKFTLSLARDSECEFKIEGCGSLHRQMTAEKSLLNVELSSAGARLSAAFKKSC